MSKWKKAGGEVGLSESDFRLTQEEAEDLEKGTKTSDGEIEGKAEWASAEVGVLYGQWGFISQMIASEVDLMLRLSY